MNCPYCGSTVSLKSSMEVYNKDYGDDVFVCDSYPACDSYVGARNGKPVGTLANPELRRLRQEAHAIFDPLWKSKHMTRKEAYKFIEDFMSLRHSETHIGLFGVDECVRLIDIMECYWKNKK